jgi:hypothetical protein
VTPKINFELAVMGQTGEKQTSTLDKCKTQVRFRPAVGLSSFRNTAIVLVGFIAKILGKLLNILQSACAINLGLMRKLLSNQIIISDMNKSSGRNLYTKLFKKLSESD